MKVFKKKLSATLTGLSTLVGFTSVALADELSVENNSIENSYKLNESTVVSKTEIPRNKYKITAKVDKNNELGGGSNKNGVLDSSWALHTNAVDISIPDVKGLKDGSTITFFKNGHYGTWHGNVQDSSGKVVGTIKTEKVTHSLRDTEYENGDMTESQIDSARMLNGYRVTITFNKEIEDEKRQDINLHLESRNWTGFEHASIDRTTYSTIRDSDNKVLDAVKMYAPKDTREDYTNPLSEKEMFPIFSSHRTDIEDGRWIGRVRAGTYALRTNRANLYKKGTIFRFRKNPESGLNYSFKDARWLKVGDASDKLLSEAPEVLAYKDWGLSMMFKGDPTIKGRYIKDNNKVKMRAKTVTDDVLELELLEDMPRQTNEFKTVWYIPDGKVTGDINLYLNDKGEHNGKPYQPFIVDTETPSGLRNSGKTTAELINIWSTAKGSGSFKPIYETVVDATFKGKVIMTAVGKSERLRPEGTDLTIPVEQSIQVDGVWYKATKENWSGKQEGKRSRKQIEYVYDEDKNLAKVNITIKHVTSTGEVLQTDVRKDVLEKSDYTTSSEKFPGYKLKTEPANKAGKVGKQNIEVVYVYDKLAKVDITTRHIDDKSGRVLKESKKTGVEEGSDYVTTPEVITDYELVKTPDNARGKVGTTPINVEYRYKYLRTASLRQRFVSTTGEVLKADTLIDKQLPGTKLNPGHPLRLDYKGSVYVIKTAPDEKVTLKDGETVLTYVYEKKAPVSTPDAPVDADLVKSKKPQPPKVVVNEPKDVPKVKTPKVEEPKVETPKVEEPKVEEPKVEQPKVEEPKVEEPKVEEPKVEEPKVEQPKVEQPKVDKDKLKNWLKDKPKDVTDADKPKVEEPKVEQPKVEQPKAEKPKVEEPKVEQPNVEEPKVEHPKAEKPNVEEPKVEQPKVEQPKVEQPKAEKPKVEEPKETSNKSTGKVLPTTGDIGALAPVGGLFTGLAAAVRRRKNRKK